MSSHASGQNTKRAAVRAALTRYKVYVSSRTYAGSSGIDLSPRHRQRGGLQDEHSPTAASGKGTTPADLMLEPERIEGDGRNTLANSAL